MGGLPDRGELVALLDAASRVDASPQRVAEARAAVDALFAANQRRVYAACLRYTGEPELAAEVAQEALLVAYRQLADYRGAGSFFSWLYGIARFTAVSALRKRRDVLTTDGLLDPADSSGGVFRDLRHAERMAVLRAAAAAVLDQTEQEAVHLRYEVGLGQDQITEILGITDASGARGVLQRCRRKLARELKRRLDDLGHGPSFFDRSLA